MEKRFLPLFLMVFLFVAVLSYSVQASFFVDLGDRILRKGLEGTDVALLQQTLAAKGYYDPGQVDGLFGPMTEKALKQFQRNNGLTADGIFGPQTEAALPQEEVPSASRSDFNRDEILLLARVIHGEARGESFKGQVAVGAVVLNRVENPEFPNSIREVVMEDGQFCAIFDGQVNYFPEEKSLEAARAALTGYDPSRGALFFYNPVIATNTGWISRRPVATRIGNHLFTY